MALQDRQRTDIGISNCSSEYKVALQEGDLGALRISNSYSPMCRRHCDLKTKAQNGRLRTGP